MDRAIDQVRHGTGATKDRAKDVISRATDKLRTKFESEPVEED